MLLLPGEKLEGFMEGPRFRNFPIVSDVPPPSPSGTGVEHHLQGDRSVVVVHDHQLDLGVQVLSLLNEEELLIRFEKTKSLRRKGDSKRMKQR